VKKAVVLTIILGVVMAAVSITVCAVDLSDVCEGVIFAFGVFSSSPRGSTEPYWPGGIDVPTAARGASEFYW